MLGKEKVQLEGVGRQNQRGAETGVKEDDWNININRSRKKRKSVKDERSSHFLWGQSKAGLEKTKSKREQQSNFIHLFKCI